jgi:hypothetical protein
MDFELLIQVFVAVIVVGVIYSLWRTTRTYGGLVGAALKWIGLGVVFFSIEGLDRALGNLSVVSHLTVTYADPIHDAILIFGLMFSGIGFSKLTKIAK